MLESVWMPSLKTHCYAIFETAEYAEAIRCSACRACYASVCIPVSAQVYFEI